LSTSGSLSQLTIIEIFKNLLEQQLTGRLRITAGPWRKVIYFERGHPVFATSSDPADSIGELLVRCGTIRREQLLDAIGKSASLKEVGKTLVSLGLLKPEALIPNLQVQAAAIILSLFALPEGSFVFEPGEVDGEDVIKLKLKTEDLLKEGARRMTDPRLLLRALGSLDATIEARSENGSGLRLSLDPKEESLLLALRGGRSSVRDICQRSKLPALATCQALIAFMAVGAASRVD
jgi:hypothetical protein